MPVLKIKKNGVWEDVAGASGHSHKIEDITNFPSSLPANGGNADTVDGKHANEFALATDVEALQNQLGDSSVSDQIATAIASKADSDHTHDIEDLGGVNVEDVASLYVWKKYNSKPESAVRTDVTNVAITSKVLFTNINTTYSAIEYSNTLAYSALSFAINLVDPTTMSSPTLDTIGTVKGGYIKSAYGNYYKIPFDAVFSEVSNESSTSGTLNSKTLMVDKAVLYTVPAELGYATSKSSDTYPTEGEHTDGYWYVYYKQMGDSSVADEDTNFIEKDPTVPTWAKSATKPEYTATEVGALPGVTVMKYGAVGDGITDDTVAFQNALAENRVVYVPGGTYVLSGDLVIRDGCELQLSIDTVLDFTQITGNCITLNMTSTLRGNHGTVRVPYAFDGNVIYVSSTTVVQDEGEGHALYSPYPFNHWDPQWKHGRYLTDLNIVKPDARGTHTSYTGDCYGIAVYISADNSGAATYIWGLDFSGLRIAGGFRYGIRAVNLNSGNKTDSNGNPYYAWNHEMRVAGFICNCEVGVSLERCHNAYVSAIIEPRYAEDFNDLDGNGKPKTHLYAKHGIELINSTNADLSGSRVWDWNATGTLWENGGQWQHIGMYGDCHGAILNSFEYYDVPSIDIRDLIYTDTASNLEKLTILQEPFTRWFKIVDGEPYFNNDSTERRILLEENLDEYFTTERIAGFTNALATATDSNGEVFNGVGYKLNYYINGSGVESTTSSGYATTGFIRVDPGNVLYCQNLHFDTPIKYSDGSCKIVYYDAEKKFVSIQSCINIMGSGGSSYNVGERTEDGMKITLQSGLASINAAYARFVFNVADIGANPIISVNNEIKYVQAGLLSDNINVKGDAILLTSPGGKVFKLAVDDNGTISTEAFSE